MPEIMELGRTQRPRSHLSYPLIGLAVLVLCWGLLRSCNRVERLLELPRGAGSGPSGGFIAVREGQVYFSQFRRPPAFSLAALSLDGITRERRVLLNESGATTPETIQLAGERIVYLRSDPTTRSAVLQNDPTTPGYGRLDSPAAPGAFGRPGPGSGSIRRRRAWWLPLTGGPPQELIPDEAASALQVSGEHCFWVRQPRNAAGKPRPATGSASRLGELLAMPLTGSVPRRIARVPADVPLFPCGTGICWRAGSAQSSALFTTGPPDFEVEAFPGYPDVSPPVWSGDRLYWLDGAAPLSPGDPPRGRSLVSTRRDGTDRQVLYDVGHAADPSQQLTYLLEGGGELFFCVDRRTREKLQRRVMRYRLKGRNRPEMLLQTSLPTLEPLSVEAGYLYLVAWEERENWFDWSARGLLRRRVGVLSRIPLTR